MVILKRRNTFVTNNVIMSLYSYVKYTIDGMSIGELVTIPIPDKIKAFRKFLSEISKSDHKKFTTKIKDGEFHIMRIKYYSMAEKLDNE